MKQDIDLVRRHRWRERKDLPLLLSLDPCPPHLRPFRFEAMWLKHHDFNQVVTASWNDNHLNFCSNVQVFGHLQQRKKKALARLNGVQRALWNKANLNLDLRGICKMNSAKSWINKSYCGCRGIRIKNSFSLEEEGINRSGWAMRWVNGSLIRRHRRRGKYLKDLFEGFWFAESFPSQ